MLSIKRSIKRIYFKKINAHYHFVYFTFRQNKNLKQLHFSYHKTMTYFNTNILDIAQVYDVMHVHKVLYTRKINSVITLQSENGEK